MYDSPCGPESHDHRDVPYQGANSVVMKIKNTYKELDLNTREILSVLEVQMKGC